MALDALTLLDLSERFDTVIDSGLFHVFSDDDRRSYVAGVASVLNPGGRFYLLCFSDDEPGIVGPRRVSEKEIQETFVKGWQIQTIKRSRYEVRPDPNDPSYKDGGPKAWFVVIGRVLN